MLFLTAALQIRVTNKVPCLPSRDESAIRMLRLRTQPRQRNLHANRTDSASAITWENF